MRNLRKLKVNSDITFAIWILEWCGTILIIFLWSIGLQTVDILLEGIIIFYYIILPHSFLMNTAHNKDRIIDEGLKNIIRNFFHAPFDLSMFVNLLQNGRHENENGTQNNVEAYHIDISKEKKGISTSNETKTSTKNTDSNTDHELKNKMNIPQIDLYNDKPSSSNGIYETNAENDLAVASMTDSEDETIDEGTENDHCFSIKKQLLIFMKGNAHNEEHYIHYFLQLIDFETKMNDENCTDNSFTIITIEPDDGFKVKTKASFKNKKRNEYSCKLQESPECFQALSSRTIMLSAEKKFDRISKRMKKLNDIDENCSNEENFNKFLNDLIDFEEGLIDN